MDPTFQPQNQNDTPNEIGLDASATSTSPATPVTPVTTTTLSQPPQLLTQLSRPLQLTQPPQLPQVIPRWAALNLIVS